MGDRRKKILIMDDETSIRLSLADFLEDAGFDVLTAGSAEEGLGYIENAELQAAIVDIRLPEMDGNEFIIRARQMNPDIGILIYTGSVDYQLNEDLIKIGIRSQDILYKPVEDMNMIATAISEIMNRGSTDES